MIKLGGKKDKSYKNNKLERAQERFDNSEITVKDMEEREEKQIK